MVTSPADAGHYEVTYSGGSVTKISKNGPWPTQPYTQNTAGGGNTWGGGAAAEPDWNPAGPELSTVDCAGPIMTTFEWVEEFEGDFPPNTAVVYEWCTSSWKGASGACSNPFSSTKVPTFINGILRGEVCTGWTASVKQNPGFSFSLPTRSPTANAATGLPLVSPLKGCDANVTYAAAAYPLAMLETGATNFKYSNDWHSQVGQKVRFDAVLGDGGLCWSPVDGTLLPFTLFNHQWQASHDEVIREVIMPSDQSTRTNVFADSSDASNEFFEVYFWKEQPGGVSLNVGIKYDGVPLGNGDAFKTLIVERPYNYHALDAGYTSYLDPNPGLAMAFTSGNPNLEKDQGVYWHLKCKSFNEFIEAEGEGKHSVVQKVTLQHIQLPFPPVTHYAGLDNEMPYNYEEFNETFTPFEVVRSDNPKAGMSGLATGLLVADYFDNMHCYKAPEFEGMPIIPVPLSLVNWEWKGTVTTIQQFIPRIYSGQTTVTGEDSFPHINVLTGESKFSNW